MTIFDVYLFGCSIAPRREDASGPDAPTVHSGGFVDGASSQCRYQ